MVTIWKYPLALRAEQTIELRKGAKIIHVGFDPQGVMCIWAVVNSIEVPRDCKVRIYCTGNAIPDYHFANVFNSEWEHIGTVMHGGTFMWHVFTERSYAK